MNSYVADVLIILFDYGLFRSGIFIIDKLSRQSQKKIARLRLLENICQNSCNFNCPHLVCQDNI